MNEHFRSSIKDALDVLGETVFYQGVGKEDVTKLTGIFDEEYVLVSEGERGIASRRFYVTIQSDDLGYLPRQKDKVTIRGVDYSVHVPMFGAFGDVRLDLKKDVPYESPTRKNPDIIAGSNKEGS